jgi:hypothetical protein
MSTLSPSAVIYLSYLWFGFWDDAADKDHVFGLNKLVPGTTLTPSGNKPHNARRRVKCPAPWTI